MTMHGSKKIIHLTGSPTDDAAGGDVVEPGGDKALHVAGATLKRGQVDLRSGQRARTCVKRPFLG
jgi:hypothetical protein